MPSTTLKRPSANALPIVLLVALMAGAAVGGAGCLVDAPCDAAAPKDKADAKLFGLLDDERKRLGVSGLGVAVVESGVTTHLLSLGRDRFDTDGCKPMTPDTLFESAGLSRTVLGLGLARAFEDGVLAPTTPVKELVPELSLSGGAAAAASDDMLVEHLLEDSSGVPTGFWVGTFACEGDSLDDVVGFFADKPLYWSPGTMASQSEPSWSLAALALQRAAQQPFADAMDDLVFAPLGMTPVYDFEDAPRDKLAVGHGGLPPRPRCAPNQASTGLIASTSDGARVAEMLTNRSAGFLTPESRARLVDGGGPRTGDLKNGWAFLGHTYDGAREVADWPSLTPGFSNDLVYFPNDDIAVVVNLNDENVSALRFAELAVDALFGIRMKPFDHSAPLSDYVGTFEDPIGVGDGPRTVVTKVDGDQLRLTLTEPSGSQEDGIATPSENFQWLNPKPYEGGRERDYLSVQLGFFSAFDTAVARDADGDVFALLPEGSPPFMKVAP